MLLPTDHRRWSYNRSPTPPPPPLSVERQSLPCVTRTLAAAPAPDARLSSPPSATSTSVRTPGRFSRGSVIQLGGGRWKRVEQLCDEDFADSAALKGDAELELMSVAHILQNHDSNTVVIGFHVSAHQTQVGHSAASIQFFVWWGTDCEGAKTPSEARRHEAPERRVEGSVEVRGYAGIFFEILRANLYILVLFGVIFLF